ncbi:hypothetical protein P3T36_004043 [Kitasatospora sp. MAP12-15]|uniref:hypothetical protein n=1 Tax=unclassified Kitasatospora TaxID=2633591 RepID=UPI0024737877|nr:hypothetical protein [Kitasatospora sp. MAP12-44]MDH6115124.1 hypothetical protein [Kitasatospora sp. MAP12-44]
MSSDEAGQPPAGEQRGQDGDAIPGRPQPQPQWQAPGQPPGQQQWQAPGQGAWQAWGYAPPPKPGVVPLAPLGLGEIVSGVFGTVKRYARALYQPLIGPTLGALAVLSVYGVIAYFSLRGLVDELGNQPDYQPTGDQKFTLGLLIVVGWLLLVVCLLALSTVASTVSTAVLRHSVLGRPVTARVLRAEAAPHFWRVLGGQLLIGTGFVGVMAVSLLPALLLGLAGARAGLVPAVGVLCALPAIGCCVYAQVRLSLLVPVIVLERSRPVAAIRRAWRLNHGAWWRSLGIPYLINMIASFATQVVVVPFAITGMVALMGSIHPVSTPGFVDASQPAPSVGGVVVFMACLLIGAALANVIALPLAPLTHGLLYVDRRIRNENLAPVLAAEAGLPGWGQAAGQETEGQAGQVPRV